MGGALFFIINLCSYTEFLLHHFDAFHCRKILKLLRKIAWELGHLQRLREEEEKNAQEDLIEEEAMNLTYDQPELINKVIFRRRVSTGTWEVCPINEASYENKSNKLSCKKKLSS